MSEIDLTAPNEMLKTKPIMVEDLGEDIEFKIPLSIELNSSNPNRTLACGFIDVEQYIFKQSGLRTKLDDEKNPEIVTCYSSHLTQFGIEEYTDEFKNL